MVSSEALRAAKQQVEDRHLGKGQVHTVMIGEVTKNGHPTGEVGVVALVDDKIPIAQAEAPLPESIRVGDEIVRVDVQQDPRFTITRLAVNAMPYVDHCTRAYTTAYDINEWRQCHNSPMPGGVQIAPNLAPWVGTLSCACIGTVDGVKRIGALTNYHVAVAQEQRGLLIGQPSGSGGDWFAKLMTWGKIDFSPNANNRIDAAFLDTWRDDGRYAPGRHTVRPYQYKIGPIVPQPVTEYRVGDAVQKSGRTTGHQTGRVVGVEATSHVGYDKGTARFVGQVVIRGDAGEFSGPGDSGSLVLTMDRRPYGLLFAGGGGTTLINPIDAVMQGLGIEFFGE